MATDPATVDVILEAISGAGDVSARKMFGEYGVYCDGKIIGLICDDQFFLKITEAGRAYIETPEEGPAYPGAKPSFVIPEDRWDDRDWMSGLVAVSWPEMPLPKAKKKK